MLAIFFVVSAIACKKDKPDDRSAVVETSPSDQEPSSNESQPEETDVSSTMIDETWLILERPEQVEGAIGKKVQITGEAENAKLSAMVMGEAAMVYCLDISGWEDDVRGTQVTVKGTLERTDQFAARTDEHGAISQGTGGGDLVLRGCQRVE